VDRQAPIFIVGAGRSGTTMVRLVLARHKQVFSPRHETQFFTNLDRIRRRFDPLPIDRWRQEVAVFIRCAFEPGFRMSRIGAWQPTDDDLSRTPSLDASVRHRDYGGAFGQVISVVAQQEGKERWIEKSPGHVFARAEIMLAFPHARFIEVVRDPRDVIASRKTMREQVNLPGRYRPEQRRRRALELSYDPFWDSVQWKAAIRAGQDGQRRWPAQWHRLRYEDLVSDPERTVRELCAFSGLTFEPQMLDVPRGRPADVRMNSPESGISRTSAGRWRSTLNHTEVGICQQVCRKEMQLLGFAPMALPARRGRVYAALLLRSTSEVVVRATRRIRSGGLTQLISTARTYRKRYLASLIPGSRGTRRKRSLSS
jgi:hypothetical protein